jgi:hypothetical protein
MPSVGRQMSSKFHISEYEFGRDFQICFQILCLYPKSVTAVIQKTVEVGETCPKSIKIVGETV